MSESGWKALEEKHGRKARRVATGLIYALLEENPSHEYNCVELAPMLGVSYATTKDAMNALEDMGLVSARGVAPTYYRIV